MAQYAAPLAIGLQLAGGIYGAVNQSDALNAQARTDEANARLAEADGARQTEDLRRKARATQGEAMAALGMNGTAIGTGSALDVITQNAIDAEWDVLNARYAASRQADALRQEAAGKRSEAKAALWGGLIGAGAQALGGYASFQQSGRIAKAGAAGRMPRAPGTTMPVPTGGNTPTPGTY